MERLNGWQIVFLAGLFLGALVILVALGQELAAIVAAGLVMATALGGNFVQGAINSEKMNQNNALANGNLTAVRKQLDEIMIRHAVERAELQAQLQAANDRAVQLAAMVTPDSKLPEDFHG